MVFCWHDWVVFRKPDTCQTWYHGITMDDRYYSYWHEKVWLGNTTNTKKFSDFTCSKCNKLNLRLQKALDKAKKRDFIKEKAAQKKFDIASDLNLRRHKARTFAQNHIEMAKKAKK